MKSTNYAGAGLMGLTAVLAFVGVNPVIVGLVALTSGLVVLTGTFAKGAR